ncbi:MAG: hypothetical protein M5U25_15180 [Planctomycetota bacterium]|nr:hypothetical protein [Planctomycetota bacterium]
MKRIATLCLVLVASLALAACGGGANNTGGSSNAPANKACGGDHGHDHEGEAEKLGTAEKDGYKISASHIGEMEPGKEAILEISVEKDGKAVPDAQISAWIIDTSEKGLSERGSGEWVADENLYDCHLKMPADVPKGAKVRIRVRHGDKDVTVDFEAHDEHEGS